jgi:hypothetical protein
VLPQLATFDFRWPDSRPRKAPTSDTAVILTPHFAVVTDWKFATMEMLSFHPDTFSKLIWRLS